VESSCYTTANMAFDIRYYSCCDDTQYSTTRNMSLVAEFPDLAITKTPVSSAPGCTNDQTWEITVTNNGDGQAQIVNIADSPGDWIDVRTSEAGDPVLLPGGGYGWEIMNLAATGDPGDSQTFTLVGTFNPDAPRDDCADGLRENNVQAVWGCGVGDGDPTTDNTTCDDDTPAEAPRAIVRMPNLVITEITPEITCPGGDGTLSKFITVRVQNQGDGPTTADFTAAVTDDGHGWTGTGDYTGDAIAPNEFANVTIDTTDWPAACGVTYSIDATADSTDAICECNETDNTDTAADYTALLPDLTVTGISFVAVDCANDDVSGEVRVTIENTGDGAASNFQVSLGTDGCLTFDNETVVNLAAGASTVVAFTVDGSW
ncbi:MAG: hypothetical protein GY842_11640, partial [bacterium]|nr:hypothetical protein [bacterium]